MTPFIPNQHAGALLSVLKRVANALTLSPEEAQAVAVAVAAIETEQGSALYKRMATTNAVPPAPPASGHE